MSITEVKTHLDIACLFHSVLFGYQKALIKMFPETWFKELHSFLPEYLDIVLPNSTSLNLNEFNTMTMLNEYGNMLIASGLAENVDVKVEDEGLRFTIEGCPFAETAHKSLNPKDVTCPHTLIACYFIEKTRGITMLPELSEFKPRNASTLIKVGTLSRIL